MSNNTFVKFILIFMFLCIGVADAKLFGAEEFVLDNGMRVVVVPNHKAPIVKHMVWYRVGAADDALGKAGTAHLLEHLMFRGTSKIRDSEFSSIINIHGGDSNAFTSYDFTAYHQSLDISKLELAMYMEADRMKNLKLNKDTFYKERDVVFQERMQTVESSPFSKFGEVFRHNFWQNHPYSRPIIGTSEEIMSIEPEDVRAFYKKYYVPNNAILVLSGDIDVETAKVLANKYYGSISAGKIGKKAIFEDVGNKKEYRLNMELPNVNNVRLVRNFITSSYNTDKSKIYALMVLSRFLGEGDTSKLYKELVLNKKVSVGVSTFYTPLSRSYSVFSISAIPAENISIQRFEDELNRAVVKVINQINKSEIDKIKDNMLAGLVYLRDNPNDAAYIVGHMVAVGYSLDEIEAYDEDIRKVTYEEVRAVANDLFNNAIVQTGVLRPEEAK